MNNTAGINDTALAEYEFLLDNATDTANATMGFYDRVASTIYYEVETIRNSQMVMGTLFLGMVLGMIIMVLCCVKHKQDGYYRVPPPRSAEEIELVEQGTADSSARFSIGDDSDD